MTMAREIRRAHSQEGVSAPELAKRYGVARSTMYQLLQGATWRELTVTRKAPRRRKALSDEETAKIKRLHSLGLSQERIGFIVGISANTVLKALKSP
jgi:DNA-binding XRE family transcriptional regulator